VGEAFRVPERDHGYAWVIVAVSFYAITMSMAARFAFGVLLVTFVREFGWSRGAVSAAFSLHLLSYGALAPFVGMAFDRYGRRRLLTLAGALLGVATASLAALDSLWQLYLFYGVGGGIASAGLGFVPHVRIIGEWFIRRKGLALGLALAGSGAASLLAPAVQFLSDHLGWRQALALLGAFIVVTACPATWWGQREPPARGAGAAQGVVIRRPPGLRRELAWLGLAYALHGFLAHMILAHEAAYLVDLGYATMWATSLLGGIGLFSVAGNVFWGFLSDWWGSGRSCGAAFAVSLAGILLLLVLPYAGGNASAIIQVVLSGLGFGGLTASLGSLMMERFGGARFGELYGLMVLVFSLGSLGGPLVAGIMYDVTQGYVVAFGLAGAAVLAAALATWLGARDGSRVSGPA
jgi:MFS family permease